jgi:hypothetical protein
LRRAAPGLEARIMTDKTRPCEICKRLIDPLRIEFMPETRLCTEHAREIEKLGGEFLITARHERTSKPGSLKRNYGGVDIEKHRNTKALRRLKADYERATKEPT